MEKELEKRHTTICSQETALHSYISIEKQLEEALAKNRELENKIEDLENNLHKGSDDCAFY